MHKIKLYGLTKSSNDDIVLTSGYATKSVVNGVASKIVSLDCLWLRPHYTNEGEIRRSPANEIFMNAIFRKQFELEGFPLNNSEYDLIEYELVKLFNYYQIYIGIDSYIFEPFKLMEDTLVLPVVLTEFGYNEINSIYKSITLTLKANQIG